MSAMNDPVEQVAVRFRSGNSVPVERATVLAEEWLAVEAEIARLRAEVNGLSQSLTDTLACEQDYLREISDLRAEADALRVDAERYRWLRDRAPDEWSVLLWIDSNSQLLIDDSLMDSKIDAAMGADA